MVDVLVCKTNEATQRKVRDILGEERAIVIRGEAVDPVEVDDLVRHTAPGVVLIDTDFGSPDGFETVRSLVRSCNYAVAVVMFAQRYKEGFFVKALRAGANGLILCDDPAPDLLSAIYTTANGQYYISSAALTHSIRLDRTTDSQVYHTATRDLDTATPESRRTNSTNDLTRREREVLRLLALGYSSRDAAGALHISLATMRSHVMSILRKLQVSSRTQAVAFAYKEDVMRDELLRKN